MRPILRHILPGLGLILVASALLLWSDLGSRNRETVHVKSYSKEHPARIGILQHSSSGVMDDLCQGLLEGLASRGYKQGDNLVADVLNAQGDQPTMMMMGQKIVSGNYDLAASISTVCLQALASADQKGRMPMVFCGVTSPVAANVGVKTMDSLDKPPHMTGFGTAQPVEAIFREAVAANPKLKVVGVVWNPSEANSLVCTERARKICAELGLTLLEAPIEGAKDVREAADSLVARGAEAFWTGGDATVINAYEILQQAADRAHIPVFSNVSGHTKKGALFDFGANYHQVGYETGRLAADILDGHLPAELPIHDMMPGKLGLNEQARATLRDPWNFTPDQYRRAGFVIDAKGELKETKAAETPTPKAAVAAAPPVADPRPILAPPGGKLPWRIQLLFYMETPPAEETLDGIKQGLKETGLLEGRDYTMRVRSAQGDMSLFNSLFDTAASDGADLYMTLSTPTLQAAVRKVQNKPVVFTFVSDPIIAGAGKTDTDHLPNFAGISTLAPSKEMVALIKEFFPKWKRIGTLFCPAEVNSMANLKYFTDFANANGLEVEAVAANTVGDLPDAALALVSKNIDAVVQIPDNLSAAGFGTIARACRTRRLPLFAFQSTLADQGATLALSMDYIQAGKDTAYLVGRVLRGDKPADLPFTRPSRQVLIINLPNARESGLAIPPALQQRADQVVK
ncbi:MAG TPA: ABC transporter substrate-binding protein [Opitutales bacterium]|nr:ABC transporter substrate-binding protein [Opitutales bacterium]